MHAYNHTFHRSIQRSPVEVNPFNQEMVWLTLYGSLQPKTPKLKVGDRVRISMMRRRFEKSYYQRWTEEEYEIAEAFTDDPPHYKIKDLKVTVLEGTFCEQEVQKVVKNDNIYKIESILKKRKRKKHQEYFVKWIRKQDLVLQHLDVLRGRLLGSHVNFHWQLGGHNNHQPCSSNDISHCSSSQLSTELDSAVSSF